MTIGTLFLIAFPNIPSVLRADADRLIVRLVNVSLIFIYDVVQLHDFFLQTAFSSKFLIWYNLGFVPKYLRFAPMFLQLLSDLRSLDQHVLFVPRTIGPLWNNLDHLPPLAQPRGIPSLPFICLALFSTSLSLGPQNLFIFSEYSHLEDH